MKVCNNPPKEAEVRKPKVKSMILKEALQYSNDRNKKEGIRVTCFYWKYIGARRGPRDALASH